MGQFVGGINTTTSLLASPSWNASHFRAPGAFATPDTSVHALSPTRLNVTTSTTAYLIGQATFSGGSMSGGGVIRARRIR
jgi:hypothetical protein